MYKILTVIILCLLFFSCASIEKKMWQIKSLPLHGFEEKELEILDRDIIHKKPNIRSVIIIRNDDLIFEKYYGYTKKDTLFDICSATKSFTSILVGIAIDQGKIESVEIPFTSFFPEYKNQNPELSNIKIKHLLSMSSGFPGNKHWSIDQMLERINDNLIEYIFTLNPYNKPGSSFDYNSLNSHILSLIITKTTSKTAEEYAKKTLFKHLNIKDYKWKKDNQGNNNGAGFLYLKTRDLAKFGMMLCNNGMFNNKQIVSKDWINTVSSVHQPGGVPHGEQYGYHFWVTTVNGYNAFFAGGFGGQFIYIVRELNLVVIITSTTDMLGEFHRDIIKDFIIPAIEN